MNLLPMFMSTSGGIIQVIRRSAVLPMFALSLAACTTNAPYAEISGERVARADGHEDSVVIAGIDGKLDLSQPTWTLIEPGRRFLLLDTARNKSQRERTATFVALDVKPCTRYFYVARHESTTKLQPWRPVLAGTEPIGECVARFGAAAAPAASAPR